MKTSTNTNSITKIVSYERAVELIAKAGFDAWDFSMFGMIRYDYEKKCVDQVPHPLNGKDYVAFCRQLKRVGEDNGIICNQSHAPFPVFVKEIRDYMKRAIECTAEVGGDICVIHPDNDASAEKNAEFYMELLPFAKEHGVRIATENMYNWDKDFKNIVSAACSCPQDFIKHIDLISDPNFVACLDIGHAEMKGLDTSAVEMITSLGKRLKALHIHDNDKVFDRHDIPFVGKIEFEPIAKALVDIGYDGYLTLEPDRYLGAFDQTNVEKGVKDLYDSVKRISDFCEKYQR